MGLAPEFPTTATGYRSVLSAVIERTVGPQGAEIDCSGTFPWDKAVAAAPTTDALYDFVGRTCLGLPLFDAADK
jgi:hypothetical protein